MYPSTVNERTEFIFGGHSLSLSGIRIDRNTCKMADARGHTEGRD